MKTRGSLGMMWVLGLAPLHAAANDVFASSPADVSVTVYRDPTQVTPDTFNLNELGGFALVSEVRTVKVPAGESRIRFEGVANGIQTSTAIMTGLPTGVLEKNRDAAILSPAALVAMTVGRPLTLVRTDPTSGQITRLRGTLSSGEEGVVFQSDQGEIEALRCSGLPETLEFDPVTDLSPTPTLSARVRARKAFSATVKLTYLTEGFDWMARYSLVIAPDGNSMDLGGWVTLANANAVSFPAAHAQVVAGRLNRESGEVEPLAWASGVVADCWPVGSTRDRSATPKIQRAEPWWDGPPRYDLDEDVPPGDIVIRASRPTYDVMMPSAALAIAAPEAAAAELVKEEALGDLKLYRVPERTTVSSFQQKQVRLVDRQRIPLEHYYGADVRANSTVELTTLRHYLRARNDSAHHLGLPLPAGSTSTYIKHQGVPLLVSEGSLRDTAVNEDLLFDLGYAADVTVSADGSQINLTNAEADPIRVEITLDLEPDEKVIESNCTPFIHNGQTRFHVTVPPQGTFTLNYQTGPINHKFHTKLTHS